MHNGDLFGQLFHRFLDNSRRRGIEGGARLVHEQDSRLDRQRAGDAESLLLSTRQSARSLQVPVRPAPARLCGCSRASRSSARLRPIDLVRPGAEVEVRPAGRCHAAMSAPYAAVVVEPGERAAAAFHLGGMRLGMQVLDDVVSLSITGSHGTREPRSRRHGRGAGATDADRPDPHRHAPHGTHRGVRALGRTRTLRPGGRPGHPRPRRARRPAGRGPRHAGDGGGPSASSGCATSGWSPSGTAPRSAPTDACCSARPRPGPASSTPPTPPCGRSIPVSLAARAPQ